MDFIRDFINSYGATILYTVITAIAGYIGVTVKKIFNKYVNDKTKKDVAKTCVRAVEQIYTDLHGRDKLEKCLESASEMLAEKGITITDIELRMLIEAAVNEFNSGFNGWDSNAEESEG
ncbi:MAG: phage holin family protein [Lachnospiraceae bacterium]|nr:phage holin family protein [Lachnospiraceae bacterium]